MPKLKKFNPDKWIKDNLEELVDKYAGGFVIVVDGKIVYTDRDGSPKELASRVKREFPGSSPLFFRVPYPHEFICAL